MTGSRQQSSQEAPIRPWRRLLVLALVLALATPGVLRLRIAADVADLLPQRSEVTEGLAEVLKGFGAGRTVYGLLELQEGSDPDRLLEVGHRLVHALSASPLVEAVSVSPSDELAAADPRLLLDLADQQTLGALRDRLQPAAVAERADTLKRLLTGPMPVEIRQLLLDDPLGMTELLGQRLARGNRRIGAAGEGFVSPDGGALLVLIRPTEDGNLGYREQALDRLRALADEVVPDDMVLRFTGTWSHSTAVAAATKRDARNLSLVSILAVLLLYLGFYRSLSSLGIVFLVLPATAWLTLAVGGFVFGQLNPIAAGALAIIFGLGIDPAIHLIGRYREARLEHPPQLATRVAVRAVAPAVAVASITTALALFAVAAVATDALGQLGLLAGAGVLINAVLMLTVLPALWLLLGERLSGDPGVGVGQARAFAALLYRANGRVLVVVALAVVVLLACGRGLRYEVDLSAFQPSTLEPVQVDEALSARFEEDGEPILVVLKGHDEQQVLVANDLVAEALAPLTPDSLAALRPARQTAEARRVRARGELDFAAAAVTLRAELASRGFRTDPFEPGLARLERLDGEADLPGWVRWFEDQHLSRAADGVRAVTRIPDQGDPVEMAARVDALLPAMPAGVQVWVTGRELVELESARVLPMFLPQLVALGGLALLLVLGLRYRRLRIVIIAALPLCAALGLFFAVHSALGLPITPFATPALPLLVGIGIDDHLFVLDRYLEGGRVGRLDETLAGAGRAVLVTTLTTLAAFGVLSLSSFDALASFGIAVVVALGLAFVSSVVVMPALLARWLPGQDAP
jgi:uncharacterized protein